MTIIPPNFEEEAQASLAFLESLLIDWIISSSDNVDDEGNYPDRDFDPIRLSEFLFAWAASHPLQDDKIKNQIMTWQDRQLKSVTGDIVTNPEQKFLKPSLLMPIYYIDEEDNDRLGKYYLYLEWDAKLRITYISYTISSKTPEYQQWVGFMGRGV